jgi:hypothetical protein
MAQNLNHETQRIAGHPTGSEISARTGANCLNMVVNSRRIPSPGGGDDRDDE